MKKLTRNAVVCGQCGDLIESTHVHDFRWCTCGNVAVDGGLHYAKRCFKTEDWADVSEYREVPNPPKAEWASYMSDAEWAAFCDR